MSQLMPLCRYFRKFFWRAFVVFSLLLAAPLISICASKPDPGEKNFSDCMDCHEGIKTISPSHPFACGRCHLHEEHRKDISLSSHHVIVRNPSDPKNLRHFCLPCHEKEVSSLTGSLHWSMAGIINQTRHMWGAQKTADPAIYGIDGLLSPLPEPGTSQSAKTPADLVDDFLRRRCLRCHLHTRGPGGTGLYRATGCASCHMPYHDDGRYRGRDAAISKSKAGYPIKHVLTRRIPNMQCLHCHHQNHVGADYEGLFAHDYSDVFRSPLVRGKPKPKTHGLDFHHLSKDVHAEKGLWCIDCHTKKDVMGDGITYSYQMEVPKRSCRDCHGGFGSPLPDPSISAIGKMSGGFFFVSKKSGEKHPLPLFADTSSAHGIDSHGRVRCSACHAQWSYQDYGLSVIREEIIQDYKWIDQTAQGDPGMEKELKMQTEKDVEGYPASMDWLSGEIKPGIWSMGWRFRRWEPMPLGVDQKGHFSVLRPRYQYFISAVDREGRVFLDSVVPDRGDGGGKGWAFMPYVPHTIAPFGRACLSCHQNRIAAGLPLSEEPTMDTRLTIPSPPAVRTMRLLNKEEKETLLQPGSAWHKERLMNLKQLHQ